MFVPMPAGLQEGHEKSESLAATFAIGHASTAQR
jgi:hypothetical protein